MRDLLRPERLTEVVDIGASPIEGVPPYRAMLAEGLCNVTGFEPQNHALAQLRASAGPHERYFPYVVGDGETHTLHLYRYPGLASLLEIDPAVLALTTRPASGEIVERISGLKTRRLDDITEIEVIDFLKIDIQGGELAVFRNGSERLVRTVAIETEVAFLSLYKGQPTFSDIDQHLRGEGFIPHCFTHFHPIIMSTGIEGIESKRTSRQLIDGDMLYVRDYSRPETMDDEQLKHLALIMHHAYDSFDVALRCVAELERRKAVPVGTAQTYLTSV